MLNILIMQQSLFTTSSYLHATQISISNPGSPFFFFFLEYGESNTKHLSVLTGALLRHVENLMHKTSCSGKYTKHRGVLLLVD